MSNQITFYNLETIVNELVQYKSDPVGRPQVDITKALELSKVSKKFYKYIFANPNFWRLTLLNFWKVSKSSDIFLSVKDLDWRKLFYLWNVNTVNTFRSCYLEPIITSSHREQFNNYTGIKLENTPIKLDIDLIDTICIINNITFGVSMYFEKIKLTVYYDACNLQQERMFEHVYFNINKPITIIINKPYIGNRISLEFYSSTELVFQDVLVQGYSFSSLSAPLSDNKSGYADGLILAKYMARFYTETMNIETDDPVSYVANLPKK